MKPSHRLGERYRNVPVLVLGAGGFIGRWVARALSSMGADLCLAMRDATRAEEIFSRYGVAGKVMAADLTNPESIRPLLLDARPAVLFNLAGYGVDPAERDEKTAYQMNADLIGTIYRTLVSAGDTSWPGQQFVHVGSALEYGSLGGDLSEDAQPRPSTVYGKSKLEGTQYLYNDHFESDCYHPPLLFNQHGDCLAAKLRPSNVHSAEDWNELLLPEIERQQAVGKQFAFRGDAAFAKPEVYKSSEERGVQYAIRIPANKSLELEIEDILFRPPGRPSRKPLVRYKSFRYQVESWSKLRRIVAKVEHHLGELFPRVGFIVTNMSLPSRSVVRFYNKRGTAEQWIKEGKQATHWTRLSCHRFRANEVRLQLSVIAYDRGNMWRRLGLPHKIKSWSLTSLQQRLMKTGGRLVKHARYWLLLAEGHLNRRLFGDMLHRIWALPLPSG